MVPPETPAQTQLYIEQMIQAYPIFEYRFLSISDLVFSPKVRYICEHECEHYACSWGCPPAIGKVEDCINLCKQYQKVFLFSTIAEVSDYWDFNDCLQKRQMHEEISRDIHEKCKQLLGDVLTLSTGCTYCTHCTYPHAPCRHPSLRLSSVESHGIVILSTAEAAQMTTDFGHGFLTYFTAVLYDKTK